MWEQTNAIGRATWEFLIELSQITARSIERVTQQEIAFVGDCAAIAVYRLPALTGVKDVLDVLMDAMRVATECGEKWIANARRVLAISLQAQNELGRWLNGTLHCWYGQAQEAAEQGQQTWPWAA